MNYVEIFDDAFIDCLFELVEQTRNMEDETFNYSVIKLIVRFFLHCVITSWGSSKVVLAIDFAQRTIHGRLVHGNR